MSDPLDINAYVEVEVHPQEAMTKCFFPRRSEMGNLLGPTV